MSVFFPIRVIIQSGVNANRFPAPGRGQVDAAPGLIHGPLAEGRLGRGEERVRAARIDGMEDGGRGEMNAADGNVAGFEALDHGRGDDVAQFDLLETQPAHLIPPLAHMTSAMLHPHMVERERRGMMGEGGEGEWERGGVGAW